MMTVTRKREDGVEPHLRKKKKKKSGAKPLKKNPPPLSWHVLASQAAADVGFRGGWF